MTFRSQSILVEGDTCWTVREAGRAAVLVDGAAYFGALRSALLKAQRSIFIVGWDIDSRVRLIGPSGEPDEEAPLRLRDFLIHLVRRRPELQVRLLLWDYSVLYALEREPLPSLNLDWSTPRQIEVCLDDVLPLGASHHQKVVVVDDAVAFCGGLDLAIRRWDTPDHRLDEPDRRDPHGEPYPPFHDVQMCVDGPAAAALAELVRERWSAAACESTDPVEPTGDPWPDGVEPDFIGARIGIARTLPPLAERGGVHEVEALYLASIRAAERFIYIENQYITARCIAEALVERLRANPALEVLIVAPRHHDSWLEAQTMQAGRARFMQYLRDSGVGERVRLVYPNIAGQGASKDVFVHAKVMSVDDRLLRVGSSNLNNRSMRLDSECDLAVEATGEPTRQAIAAVTDRLLGEHLGATAREVGEVRSAEGSLFVAVDRLSGSVRSLVPIRDEHAYDPQVVEAIGPLADPEQPMTAPDFIGDMFGGEPSGRWAPRLAKLAVAALLLIVLAVVWRFTPLSEAIRPENLQPTFERLTATAWAPLVVPAIFVVGSLVVFPVTVLIALTAVVFGPWLGFAYALAGSLLAALATYLVGHATGRETLRNAMGQRVNRISRALGRRGVLSIAAVRLVPIAPFSLVNLVAGASHIRLSDFMLGTLLGMLPGIAAISALGYQLFEALKDPGWQEIAVLVVLVAAWLGLSLGLQALIARWRGTT